MAIRTLIYYPSSSPQLFVVPLGVSSLEVDCVASRGMHTSNKQAGNGGRVRCKLSVTQGQTLYFIVGNIPVDQKIASYNASDIRTDISSGILSTTSFESRLIVAGGGGSAGDNFEGYAGGGEEGLPLSRINLANDLKSPTGGAQTAGGLFGGNWGASGNGTRGKDGSLGLGGNSGNYGAGAGGAGYYGGGGGGSHKGNDCGGGGGSSYINPIYCTKIDENTPIHTQGYNDGEGYIIIKYESDISVRFNQLYKGSRHVDYAYMTLPNATIGSSVKRVYKGSELIYILGFNPVIYYASNSLQIFDVPPGIDKVKIDCVASKGMNGGSIGGKGARVQCILNVTNYKKLYIMVGKIPTSRNIPVYNASDIRFDNSDGVLGVTSLESRLIVAGGGGSGAGATGRPGGDGAYPSGLNAVGFYSTEAIGGSQIKGGTGAQFTQWSSAGYNFVNGGDGQLGLGGTATDANGYGIAGAGGAGYYGGGGGIGAQLKKVGKSTSGGAGGSSYTDPTLCSKIDENTPIHTQGYNDGEGYIIISMVD